MKHLVIIGARGFGRELCLAAEESLGYGLDFDIKGFLDSKKDALVGFTGYPPILDAPETYNVQPDDVFICALGDVRWRKHYADMMIAKGGEFISVIHKSASLGRSVKIGAGCYVANNAVLTADIQVGDHTCIFHGATIGHDVRIGMFSHLSAQVFLGGGVEIGDSVVMQPGARVVPHKKIKDGAEVGIGSVVISNVKMGVKVFGIPAMPLEI